MVSIYNSKYKNKESIVLESGKVRIEFIPVPGGKIASLICKETGREFLVQRKGDIYREQPFDGVYIDGECSGYDDMFPTIDICEYEKEPWKGIKMADHGEVWALPWDYKINNNSLHLSVKGGRFPYLLEKKVSFINENTIRTNYVLTNNNSSSFDFLWAGHFMINIEEGARLILPDDCKEAVTIESHTDRKFGDINYWPYFTDNNGKKYRGDICRPRSAKGFEKYYFTNKLKDGWCELIYPDNKNKLKISFPVDTVPYLGLLMNENGWDDLYNVFIEPCTICYDRPDIARTYGQVSRVEAFSQYNWFLDIEINNNK